MKNNNKGFTLVELLAVISILGAVIVVTYSAITNVFYKSKKMIDSYTEEILLDAARTYAIDLDEGKIVFIAPNDLTVNNHEYKKGKTVSIYDTKVYLIEHGLEITVKDLKNINYFEEACDHNKKPESCKVPETCKIKIAIEGEKTKDDKYYISLDYQATLLDGC